jgi:hypothetical protein
MTVEDRFLRQLATTHHLQVRVETVRRQRRLVECDLLPRQPALGPILTSDHRRAKVKFAREHSKRKEKMMIEAASCLQTSPD